MKCTYLNTEYLNCLDAVRDLRPELIHHNVELLERELGELDLEPDLVLGADPLLDIGVVLEEGNDASCAC